MIVISNYDNVSVQVTVKEVHELFQLSDIIITLDETGLLFTFPDYGVTEQGVRAFALLKRLRGGSKAMERYLLSEMVNDP